MKEMTHTTLSPKHRYSYTNSQTAGWIPEPVSSRWRSCYLSLYPEYSCEPCCQMWPRKIDHVIFKRRIVIGVFCGILEVVYFSMCLEVRLIQAGWMWLNRL